MEKGGNLYMSSWLSYVILVLGFVLLTKGADYFVEGAAAAAKKMRIPTFIIGMTIVAMGTSAPECAVSVTAALKHNNELAVSNAVGSNIFNLMVVCGVCAVIMPLSVQAGILKREFPFSILVALFLLGLGATNMSVNRVDGGILLTVFALFLFWMVYSAKKSRKNGEDEEEIQDLSTLKCLIFMAGGLAAIIFGGDWVVDAASVIAKSFGMSQNLIGLTVVAFGTSLPELVTSIAAARKNQADMALGNVIGSNIFNILLILGLAATISPLSFNQENMIDIGILIIMSAEVFFFAQRGYCLSRMQGAVLLIEYAAYVTYICVR